jgi:S-adenosylmethionine hydrolase
MARHSARPSLVTLLTDFGLRDPYPAAMKGVILRTCPAARIVDISHGVPAHDVLAGALVLAQAAPYFPPGTVHVVVVDPGVGTDRSVLVARFGGQLYVFPDNGVITLVAERVPLEELVTVRHLERLVRPGASMTFHGRDIFAPLAGQILNGLDIRTLGPQPPSYKLLELPAWQQTPGEIVGEVVYVDSFGNLVTNIPADAVRARWAELRRVRGSCAGRDVGPLRETYAQAEAGETLILFNSMGMVEVAVNRGRAADVLNAGVGTVVRLTAEA